MKRNLSNLDKTIRILIALAIGGLYFGGLIGGTLAIVLGAIATIFVVTSFINFCPLYAALGLSSFKKKLSK